MKTRIISLIGFFSSIIFGYSADLYVNDDEGFTIAHAVKAAKPGDTIHLKPGTHYQSVIFSRKHGLPDKPITIDGHGAILDGSRPVTQKEWEQVAPDLYRRAKLYPNTDNAIVGRWYLLRNGEMQRMNRCSKGPTEPLKAIDQLQPGEWTYQKSDDAFYLKLEPGQDLDTANIRYPARSSGVIFSQEGSWITVKNITSRYVYNDGFNIHGAQRNLVFENIAATYCGDDGFSAHEDADCRINGFTSIGNATGLCDVGTSQTHYRNLSIKDCVGYDLYFIGLDHSVENALIESSAARAFWLDGARLKKGGQCRLKMKNVYLRRVGDVEQELRIAAGGFLHATNCTFEGLNVMLTPGGSVDFRSCVFKPGKTPISSLIFPNTIWRGQANHYEFLNLRVAQTNFNSQNFDQFKKLTGSEADSVWSNPPTEIPTNKGADLESLEHQAK